MAKGKNLHIAELTAKNVKYKRALKETEVETKKSAGAIQKSWDGITSSIKNAAGGFLAFSAAWKVKDFITDSIKLSAKAEGVRQAFDRLNRPNLLNELREATRNTTSDLVLMQTAIRASNFKIPLDQLATLLEFATKRATQTGESVDYLVNSIIDGIGRKSTLVLDNLGISATELQEEVKRVGDFGEATGNIVSRELEQMGDVAETTATRIAQINTAIDNIQLSIGDMVIGATAGFLDVATAIDEFGGHGAAMALALNSEMQAVLNTLNQIETLSARAVGSATNKARETASGKNADEIRKLIADTEVKINALKKLDESTPDLQNDIAQQAAKLNVYKSLLEGLTSTFNPYGKKVTEIKDRINQLTEAQNNLIYGSEAYLKNIKEIEKLRGLLSNSKNDRQVIGLLDIEKTDDVEDALNKFDEEMNDHFQKWAEAWSSGFVPKMLVSTEEFANVTDERIQQILDNWIAKQERIFYDQMNAASQLGYAIQDAFNPDGTGVLAIMNKMLQTAIAVAATLRAVNSGNLDSTSGTLGILGSLVGFVGGFLASGGPAKRNVPYVVGEKGPEIFMPKTSGTVLPNEVFNTTNNFNDRNITRKLDAVNNSIQSLTVALVKDRVSGRSGRDGSQDLLKSLTKIITNSQNDFEKYNEHIVK